MKLFKILCVIAIVCAMSAVAYAETQTVKVSGDIALRALARHDYDLNIDDPETAATGSVSNDWESHLMSTTEVQVDADLTDNVASCIRLVNQRVWGDGEYSSVATNGTGLIGVPYRDRFTGVAVNPTNNDTAFDVVVDLAYIELKEFLYSPLTLKIGRQDLWFGKGFIVGAQQQDPQGSLFAREYTAVNSFDAVRATLDYDPWAIDAVFSKIAENSSRADDDVNLLGLNVGYMFDKYNAEAETYYWFRQQRYCGAATNTTTQVNVVGGRDSNDIHTIGTRGSFDPIEDWTVAVEGAFQFGDYIGASSQITHRQRKAFALDALVECRYWQDDFAWKPVLDLEYIYYSGEDKLGSVGATTEGIYSGWDQVYRGKFDTAIREFQNVYYGTTSTSTPATTNQHQLLVSGKLEPTDSLTLDAKYGHFWLVEEFTAANTDKNIGDELDFQLTWDYTEDVSFNLLAAWFFPGNHFADSQDNIATDLVGTVKLSF